MRSVLDGTLDGAFVAGATGHAELSSVPVRRERLALFSTAGTKTTPVANLLAGALLVLPHGCSYRQSLEQWLDAECIFPERAVEFDSIGALLASVSAGLGAALFPESLASVYTAAKGLICHAVPEPYLRLAARPLYGQHVSKLFRASAREKQSGKQGQCIAYKKIAVRNSNFLTAIF